MWGKTPVAVQRWVPAVPDTQTAAPPPTAPQLRSTHIPGARRKRKCCTAARCTLGNGVPPEGGGALPLGDSAIENLCQGTNFFSDKKSRSRSKKSPVTMKVQGGGEGHIPVKPSSPTALKMGLHHARQL